MYQGPTSQADRFLGRPAGAEGRAEGPERDLETPVIDGQPILGLPAGPAGWLIAAFRGMPLSGAFWRRDMCLGRGFAPRPEPSFCSASSTA
jgi:hypothetical protein